jgi:hypothetical protein
MCLSEQWSLYQVSILCMKMLQTMTKSHLDSQYTNYSKLSSTQLGNWCRIKKERIFGVGNINDHYHYSRYSTG